MAIDCLCREDDRLLTSLIRGWFRAQWTNS